MPHVVDQEKCTGCAACVDSCPTTVITMEADKAKIGADCVDCGTCVDACPNGAIAAG